RRRHTRFSRDWSSDVCSSDLVWSPRDYSAFAREGYARNPVVYRAVRMIAEGAASIPIRLFENGVEVSEHPLLCLIGQPNAAACRSEERRVGKECRRGRAPWQ